MKLLSLQILGEAEHAWSSRRWEFAEQVTQLFGPNGCGKTPIVQSAMYALGYEVEFRDDILSNCTYVFLEILAGKKIYSIKRSFKRRNEFVVETQGQSPVSFSSQRDFSRFAFDLWRLDYPTVMDTQGQPTPLYSGLLLPIFYLDQNHGYTEAYYSPRRFVRDQYAEVMRALFGLAPKHAFDKKRAASEIRESLEYIDRAIFRIERDLETIVGKKAQRRSVEELDAEIDSTVQMLKSLSIGADFVEKIQVDRDDRLTNILRQQRHLSAEKSELESQVRGLAQIRHEIEIEADTLSLNEDARKVFASFEDICVNPTCGLFVRSSGTYGKSLLYLKDQIKDLNAVSEASNKRIQAISEGEKALAESAKRIKLETEQNVRKTPVEQLVFAASELTERLISLKSTRAEEGEARRLEGIYVDKLEERNRTQAKLAEMERSGGGLDIEVLRLRAKISERVRYWLEVLNTSNVGAEVAVDADFNVTFDGQRLNKFNGSTLTRLVLAVRTAIVELITSDRESVPQFFVLDAPRQHDIERVDFVRYIAELKKLSAMNQVQIIFSTSNFRYDLDDGDVEWVPTFPGEKHKMFLGVEQKPAAGENSQNNGTG
ncbi:prefoldin subunit 5 [Xanthomonas arboricola]